MSESMLENNVAELLKRCHRTISGAQVERSLAAFERRMTSPRSPSRWYPAVAAALFIGLAAWIALKPKAPALPVPQPAVKAPIPQESDESSRLAKADKLRLVGKFTEAIALIDEALRSNPTSTVALNLRCRTLLEAGDFEKAVQDASRAIQINPKDIVSLWIRAEARIGLRDYDAGMRDASAIIKVNASWDQPFVTRARLKAQLKDYQGSMDDLAKALKVTEAAGPIYLVRGRIKAEFKGDPLKDYMDAAGLGSFTDETLALIGADALPILKEGLARAASPEIAARISEALKKYPEGAEAIRKYDELLRLKKAQDEEIARLIVDLGGPDAVRAKAEARLIAIGKPALELLGRARYHEVPEARVMAPKISATIIENSQRDEEIAKLRVKVAAVRKRWAARDFTEFETEVLANNFEHSVHYVPMKKIASPFQVHSGASDLPMMYRGTADQLTPEIVEALDKNDGMVFVAMVADTMPADGSGKPKALAAPVAFGPCLVFTLPDNKGWSAYVVAYVKM